MKNSKKIKLKWKIFFYMLGFTGLLIALLWILQTVYLDKFYKYIKTNELNKAIGQIEKNINNEDLYDAVNSISKNYDVCIVIAKSNGNILYSAESNVNCQIHHMNQPQISYYFKKVVDAGGQQRLRGSDFVTFFYNKNQMDDISLPDGNSIDRYDNSEQDKRPSAAEQDIAKYKFEGFQGMPRRNDSLESIIDMRILEHENEKVLVMINSIITPVDATVYTIRVQLVFISIILVLLALFMATIISMNISKSITKLNEGARKLAKGEFDIEFSGNDYREIAELSDTLNYATKELAKSGDLQRELIANVSHDLRTPLTMITAYSEVMRDIPGENSPENIQVVIDEAKRLSMLVNDLIDISKLQADADNINLSHYDLTAAIKNVIGRYGKLTEQEGYTITFEHEDNVTVEADEYKIYQVVYNLVNNAINYTGEDKRVIVKQVIRGPHVRIEVRDSGAGIAQEELSNVWERYYKIDKKHKRAVAGTGLGLSIVKSILQKHNANYGVESELGKGSTFWFELKIFEEK